MGYKCPKCGSETDTQGIGFVNGIRCKKCNWSAIWCYQCNKSPMKAIDPNLNGWLECPSCGKRTRLAPPLYQWLHS
jgi:hypothetical protein